jgi:hypothetical protein
MLKEFTNFLLFRHPECKESLAAKISAKGLFGNIHQEPTNFHLSPFDEDATEEIEGNCANRSDDVSSPCDLHCDSSHTSILFSPSLPSSPPSHLEILENGSSSSKSGSDYDRPGTPCFEPPCISSSVLLPNSKSSRRAKKKAISTLPPVPHSDDDHPHRSPHGKKRCLSFFSIIEENGGCCGNFPIGLSSSCSDRGGSSPPNSRSSSAFSQIPFTDSSSSSNHFQTVYGSPNIPIESLVLSQASSPSAKRPKSVPLRLHLDFEVSSSSPPNSSCSLMLPPKCTRGRSASYTDELVASLPPSFLPPSFTSSHFPPRMGTALFD